MKSKLSIILFGVCLSACCAGPIPEKHYEEPPATFYSLDNKDKLIQMAEKRFGKLTAADKILFAAVADGNWADYSEGEGKDKPEDANDWGERRIIDANRIEWLCRDRQAKELVADKGIQVIGVKIKGSLDLSFAEVPFPLSFWECDFTEEINMYSSMMKFLVFKGSHTGSIMADGIKVEGGVFLRDNFKANGEVSFIGADIRGEFDCTDSEFINQGGRAISADRMNVKGAVFLKNGFKANGVVGFLGAVIGRDFICNNGEFISENGIAISADGIEVEGNVCLGEGFKAYGEIRFLGAEIGGDLVCENGEFEKERGRAISADKVSIKGSVFLRNGFKAKGEVCFPIATIGGDFDCHSGEFINTDGITIFASGIDIKGSMYLKNGFKSNGEIILLEAKIGRNFECDGGEFINEGRIALLADGMDVKGSVFLRNGFEAKGEVRFLRAVIDSDLDCTNGEFINGGGEAIFADGMIVKSAVFLRDGFKAEGLVSFAGTTVGEYFFWSDVNLSEKTALDLRNAKIGVLNDDEKSWPDKENLFLDGFCYENIGYNAPKDAKSRIKWLNRQGDKWFRPQPYEQLAKVLEKMGHDEDAIKIRIEKEKRITKHGGFNWLIKFGRGVLHWTIGYGYRSQWALYWIVGFILFGFGFFEIGYRMGVIVPMEKDAHILVLEKGRQLREGYPKFSALIYSIEMFVPVLDLRMAKYWIPDANKKRGTVVRWYMWIHIIFGWILTTLLIVGLTGLIK